MQQQTTGSDAPDPSEASLELELLLAATTPREITYEQLRAQLYTFSAEAHSMLAMKLFSCLSVVPLTYSLFLIIGDGTTKMSDAILSSVIGICVVLPLSTFFVFLLVLRAHANRRLTNKEEASMSLVVLATV